MQRLWEGRDVYIIGGGLSLKGFDFSLIHDQRVIGVNDSFLLGSWVDACWFGDNRWWEWNIGKLRNFGGLKATCATFCKDKKGISWYRRNRKGMGIITKGINSISWNRCSGFSAINYAYHLGAHKIILLGFDNKKGPNGELNWHTNHKRKGKNNNPYRRFLECIPSIVEDANNVGLEIVNAGPIYNIPLYEGKKPIVREGKEVQAFPVTTLEETLR